LDASKIDGILADAGMKLKKEFPFFEFFVLLIPLNPKDVGHLSREEMQQMERICISSATRALDDFLKNPKSPQG
jgi:hypothetical protein